MSGCINCSSRRQLSVQTLKNGDESVQEDLLLQQLSALSGVELQMVNWCLSQNILQDFPPIPPRWLRSANASHITKIMMRCYQVEGALRILPEILRMMKPHDQNQDSCRSRFCTAAPPIIRPAPNPDPDFVRTHRRKLISRMQWPGHVLNALEDCQVLNSANREAISIFAGVKNKNRALVDLVLKRGDEAQRVFCQALNQSEPFLLKELNHHPISDKKPVLTEMLEFLVSDELGAFQWLASSHMCGESCSPIGGEQLHLQRADRPTTQEVLEKYFGPEQATDFAQNILQKIVPLHSLGVQSQSPTSDVWTESRDEMNADTTLVEVTPEVHEDGSLFRLRCQQAAVIRCSVTGLMLEGAGDVIYQTVPWDMDFLSSKGLRPAGPLFRFTLLTGRFHRLHLPHCQLPSGGGRHTLSVAHVTEDCVDFITPLEVTDDHVAVGVSSFSCFGLVMAEVSGLPIRGLVLLFSQLSGDPKVDSSLYVLLLPRNVLISEVRKEWHKRNRAEYVECPCECELIPYQTYSLSGQPVTVIQPEFSKFLNFCDYNNFFSSFEVQLASKVKKVKLQLMAKHAAPRLIGWLIGSTETVVWTRFIQMKVAGPSSCEAEMGVKSLLVEILQSLQSHHFEEFQHFLSLRDDPIPRYQLEAADRMTTVDLMVQKYLAEGAKDVTVEILRKMNLNDLAQRLENS